MSEKKINYAVDLVLCIDCTGSMYGVLDNVKANAMSFANDLKSTLGKQQKQIDQLRVKVIAYRDYYCDGDMAMNETAFFELPKEEDAFNGFIQGLEPSGGGDEPESGLEALALAMNADWTKEGKRQRHVIVVWTDASSHPLDVAKTKPSIYPTEIPKDFDELSDAWDGQNLSKSTKRLVIFAPDAYPWTDIENSWENTIQHTARAGAGLADVDYEVILNVIANSI